MTYEKALEIATEAHKGQKRWNGDDYITHPIRVASQFDNEQFKIVSILHDVLEDTNVTAEELNLIHGIDQNLVNVIIRLTKLDGESYADYITRVNENAWARVIKIEDLKDNLRDLEKGQRRDKYELALKILEN